MSELGYREKYLRDSEEVCTVCGSGKNVVVHHIDGDRDNNKLNNLTGLCQKCHGKVHAKEDPEGDLQVLQDQLPDSSLIFKSENWGNPHAYLPKEADMLAETYYKLNQYRQEHGHGSFDSAIRELLTEADA